MHTTQKDDMIQKFLKSYSVIVFLVFLMMFFCKGCHAQEIPPEEAIARAIWHTEGGNNTAWPYGVKHHYKHTTPHQACLNTIRHQERLWDGQGDFIVFLGETYSPPDINHNWVRLVKYFLRKEGY